MTLKKQARLKAMAAGAIALTAVMGVSALPADAYGVQETRVYTWANGESQPNIPQTITGADGQTLTLVSTSQPSQADASRTVTQPFSQSVQSTCAEADIPNLGNMVPGTYRIDSGGFTGDIPRTGIDYTPIYRSEDQVVETTDTIMTSTDDPSALPANVQTISYQGRTLALSGVDFEPVRYEGDAAVLFQATLHYSGTFQQQVLDHYAVTAHYSGTLTRVANDGEWSVSAVYEGPDEEDDNPEAGVTASFNDDESGTFQSNPDDPDGDDPSGNANGNASGNQGQQGGSRGEAGGEGADEGDEGLLANIPLIPIAAGAGAVVVFAGVGIGVGVARSKKKKANAAAQPVGYDENGNAIMPDGSVIAPDGTLIAAAGAVAAAGAGAAVAGGAQDAAEAMFIADDPQEPIECELIRVKGEDDQELVALLDVAPSIAKTVPTIITFPAVGEEGFVPEEGADYYIALEDVSQMVSDEMIVVSAEGELIYRGALADQMRLDADRLAGAVNGTLPDEQRDDVSALVAAYEAETEELRAQRDAEKDALLAASMDDDAFASEEYDPSAGAYDGGGAYDDADGIGYGDDAIDFDSGLPGEGGYGEPAMQAHDAYGGYGQDGGYASDAAYQQRGFNEGAGDPGYGEQNDFVDAMMDEQLDDAYGGYADADLDGDLDAIDDDGYDNASESGLGDGFSNDESAFAPDGGYAQPGTEYAGGYQQPQQMQPQQPMGAAMQQPYVQQQAYASQDGGYDMDADLDFLDEDLDEGQAQARR